MTRIESKHIVIPKSATSVSNFLVELKNIEQLLPQDKISNFIATDKTFSFKISGAVSVELELVKVDAGKLVQLKTTANNSFQFTLDIFIKDNGTTCEVHQVCNADINTFMKMMIEKPLSALFDYMVDRLLVVCKD